MTATVTIKDEFGFKSNYWHGLKTLSQLNGSRQKYRGVIVDVVDLHTRKIITRMELGTVLMKFN